MRYFVLSPDGRLGPISLDELKAWALGGRISAGTIMEEEGSARRVLASSLPDLRFKESVSPGPMQPIQPGAHAAYRRPGDEPPLFLPEVHDGRRALVYSFLLAFGAPVLALFSMYGLILPFGAIWCAIHALRRGTSLAWVSLALAVLAIPAAVGAYLHELWLR